MQKYTIPIGTSQGPLNLADGLPLFPVIGAARAGISNTSRANPLIDGSFTVLFLRTKVVAYYEFLMGVLGPSIAFKFPNSEVTLLNPPSGHGEVRVNLPSNQQMIAGMGIGVVLGAGIKVTQQLYLPSSWYTPWKLAWKTVFEISLKFELDLIKLLLTLIKYLLAQSRADGLIEKDTGSGLSKFLGYGEDGKLAESFKFYAYSSDRFGPGDKVSATPKHTIPYDITKITPSARAFMGLLAAINAEMQYGPCLELQMPVTLKLDSFTVGGGQGLDSNATYGPITYDGSTAVAPGEFSFSSIANRFTTNVRYSTGFVIAISYFFKISVMKVFSVQVNTGSLDLLNLLELKIPPYEVTGSVSTDIKGGCVLVPEMAISFTSAINDLNVPNNTVIGGLVFSVEVILGEPWAGLDTNISLSVSGGLQGFPTSVPIRQGEQKAYFKHTIENQFVIVGDPKDRNAKVPPSSTSPNQAYLVTATIPQNDADPCVTWEVTAPLTLRNRVLEIMFYSGTAGDAPVWNRYGGAQLNADPAFSPANVDPSCRGYYSFPSVPGQTLTYAPIRISLYDDERKLHSTSDVQITFDSGQSARLSPSATLTLPIRVNEVGFFTVNWRSKGSAVNYSSLFYLVMDGGREYGQTEFWLSIWNWS